MQLLPIVNHSLGYNRSIDGLRGIAILSVLLFHLFPNYFSFGYIGVDIFFVLSGFLITQIISTKMQNETFSFTEFYRNRIRRIFPAMIIVLFVAFVIGYLFLFPSELIELAKHIRSSSLFKQNFNLINEAGYWDKASTLKPLLHFWSLSIEEQFYIFWPMIIWMIYRYKLNIILVFFIIFLTLLVMPQFLDIDRFYHSLSRFWELALGGFILILSVKYKDIKIEKFEVIIITLFVLAIAIATGNEAYNLLNTLFITITTAVLIVLLTKKSNHKIFGNSILLFFGLISFPLYLWHYLLLGFANIVGYDSLYDKLIILTLSILLSYTTYIFIELRARANNSYKFASVLFLIAIFIALAGGYTRVQKGLPKREHLMNLNIQPPRPDKRNSDGLQLVKSILDRNSSIDQIKSNTTVVDKDLVVMIGDSHSYTAYDGISEELKKYGYSTINISNNSSPAFVDTVITDSKQETKNKLKHREEVYEILNKINPRQVIFTSRLAEYIKPNSEYQIYKDGKFITDVDIRKKAYFSEVEKVFAYFNARNIKLDYILENPELDFNPDSCTARPFGVGKVRDCKISLQSYIQRDKIYNDQIYKIASKYPNVKILDPTKAFCDDRYCYAKKDGKILYFDNNHLNAEGSRVQAKKLIGEIIGKEK